MNSIVTLIIAVIVGYFVAPRLEAGFPRGCAHILAILIIFVGPLVGPLFKATLANTEPPLESENDESSNLR